MGAGDAAVWEDIAALVDPPLVHLVAQTTQSMASNTTNAIAFGTNSEYQDTHGFHNESTNNSRITPTVPGIYRVSGKVAYGARADFRITDAWLRMNGSTAVDGSSGRNNASTASANSTTVSANQVVETGEHYIEFNGSTDYVELLGVQTNTAAADPSTAASGQFRSTLSLAYYRPA